MEFERNDVQFGKGIEVFRSTTPLIVLGWLKFDCRVEGDRHAVFHERGSQLWEKKI